MPATLRVSPEGLRVGSTGHWPWRATVRIPGMKSVSPDSCVFHAGDSARFLNLSHLVFSEQDSPDVPTTGSCSKTSSLSWLLPCLVGEDLPACEGRLRASGLRRAPSKA